MHERGSIHRAITALICTGELNLVVPRLNRGEKYMGRKGQKITLQHFSQIRPPLMLSFSL